MKLLFILILFFGFIVGSSVVMALLELLDLGVVVEIAGLVMLLALFGMLVEKAANYVDLREHRR